MDPSSLVALFKRLAAIVGGIGSIVSGITLIFHGSLITGWGLVSAGLAALGLNLSSAEQKNLAILGNLQPQVVQRMVAEANYRSVSRTSDTGPGPRSNPR